ncbi:hypothetical protein ACFE04_031191 [Oxalis oulophora]
MEEETVISPEEISDHFTCCVCLELLHKPIVLRKRHFDFRSMSFERESHCPICRYEYTHFPTICEMLHFLLKKLYPIAYERREAQVLEEEKKNQYFSPQFDHHICGSDDNSKNHTQNCDGNSVEEKGNPENKADEKHELVSIADALCAACKQFLIYPLVLNCGHVYCGTCIVNLDGGLLKCQVCPSVNPSGIPKTCLPLDHFLEEKFPEEYSVRKIAVQLQHKEITVKLENASSSSKQEKPTPSVDLVPWWADPDSKVHAAVGCDSCGMYPIIGERYRCKDCVEKIGFDLCGDCYKTTSKLPGRFNQQHTPDHKFELIKLRKMKLKLVKLEDGTRGLVISDDDEPEEGIVSGGPQSISGTMSIQDQAESILSGLMFVDEPYLDASIGLEDEDVDDDDDDDDDDGTDGTIRYISLPTVRPLKVFLVRSKCIRLEIQCAYRIRSL